MRALLLIPVFFSLTALGADPRQPAVPVPPPAKTSQLVKNTPKLIDPADVKKFVKGLTGKIDASTRTATIQGRIHDSCVDRLRLEASGTRTASGVIAFALIDRGGGLECLKKTSAKCEKSDESACSSFAELTQQEKHRKNYQASVLVKGDGVEKLRAGLASNLSVLNDKSLKLEAVSGCDCDLEADGSISPRTTQNAAELAKDVKAATDQVIAQDQNQNKPGKDGEPGKAGEGDAPAAAATVDDKEIAGGKGAKGKKDRETVDADRDEDEDDPDKEDGEGRKLRPGMKKVYTDKEIDDAVKKDMQPYQQMMMEAMYKAQMMQMQNQITNLQFQLRMSQQNQNQQQNGQLGQYNFPGISQFNYQGMNMQGMGGMPSFMSSPAFSSPFGLGLGHGR